jgi:hypothetical protein
MLSQPKLIELAYPRTQPPLLRRPLSHDVLEVTSQTGGTAGVVNEAIERLSRLPRARESNSLQISQSRKERPPGGGRFVLGAARRANRLDAQQSS